MDPIESDVLLQEPFPYRVVWKDGTKETFLLPKLGADGLIPWLDEMTEERRAVSREVFKKMKLPAIDAMRAEKAIMLNDVAIIPDLIGPVQRPAGMRRVIALSLANPDAKLYSRLAKDATNAVIVNEPITPERQAQLLQSIMSDANMATYVSQSVSTLFYRQGEAEAARQSQLPPAPPTGGLSGPLAEGGAPPSPASESPTTGLA